MRDWGADCRWKGELRQVELWTVADLKGAGQSGVTEYVCIVGARDAWCVTRGEERWRWVLGMVHTHLYIPYGEWNNYGISSWTCYT